MHRRLPIPLLLAGLVALPVLFGVAYAVLAVLGVTGAGATGEMDLRRLAALLTDRTTWRSVSWSLHVALISTALATLAAAAVALIFPQSSRADRIARSLATLPLPVPHLVAAATALFVLGQSGLLARMLYLAGMISEPAAMPPLVYDRAGVALIVALAWKELPFLAVVGIALRTGVSRELEEAARTLGATPSYVTQRVVWPLLWRGMLPAVIATFIFAFGSYESAVLLAPVDPAPLPVLTMERFADPALARRGEAYGLALIALLVGAVAVAVHEWTRSRWGALVK
jgi:putative spermidine/putrescine transport system permease protein